MSPTAPRICSTCCAAARAPRPTSCCSSCCGRALLALKRAQALGAVQGVTPPQAAFESDDFDGRFSFRLESSAAPAEIERAVRGAGDVEHVSVGGEERRAAAPRAAAAGAAGGGVGAPGEAVPEKSRHIRVDLRRLDELMDVIGE